MLQQRIQIPKLETGHEVAARQAHRCRPKENLTVSQWAEKHMAHYDPEILPFLAEIMDACSDPETSEIGDMGPAQGGKSTVGEAFIGWSIAQDPAPFLMAQPDKTATETYVKLRINPLINSTPALKAELLPVQSADNMHLKLFRGMYFGAAWPVKSQFRQRTYRRGWLDDFDAFPDDIEGEGDAIGLLEGRMTFYKGRDTKLVSSSPAKEGGGIEVFVEGGTDERLQPVCPECGDRAEFDLIRDLKFNLVGTPDDAAATAHVVCPANGCVLEPEARHQLIASLAQLPNRGFVAKRSSVGKFRRTFRRDGLLSFTDWRSLARQWRDAQIAWDERQDEGPLRTFWNTKAGKNYRSKASGEKPIESDALERRLESHWQLGTVPRGPKVINITVDVQHDRFECAAIGTAAGRETWLIDRFAIHALDDGLTGVQPFVHKEHWKALLPLFDRKYPMVDEGVTVGHAPVLSVTVDTGGSDKKGDQATEGSKYFYQAARALGVHRNRITLVKGASTTTSALMPAAQFADQKVKGGARKTSARLWRPNVHKIKNMIDARLRREVPGPGYIHMPADLADDDKRHWLEEITAEELIEGKWKARRARNETWDLLVYAEAAILKPPFAQSRSDMRWIPRGFGIIWPNKGDYSHLIEDNAAASSPAAPPEPIEAPAPEPKPTRSPRRRRARADGRPWLQRKR